MNDRPALKELTDKMLIRRRLLESAKENYDVADYDLAVRDILAFLDNAQANDEAVVHLYHECIGLVGYCSKTLQRMLEIGPAPIVVPMVPSGTPREGP